MQDGNAHLAVGVDWRLEVVTVWVPHLGDEAHLGRVVGVVLWEFQYGLEEAALESMYAYFVESVARTFENYVPMEQVVIILKAHGASDLIVLLEVWN